MKVYFHLGIHKTASTFLQKEIFPKLDNFKFIDRANFKELKNYILYTDDFVFKIENAKDILSKILQGNKKDIIISDEEFYGNPFLGAIDRKRNIDRIINIFGSDLHLLIFIRNQFDLVDSFYNQYVKTGGTAGFVDFCSYSKYPFIFNSNYFLYYEYLNYVKSKVPDNKLKIFLFEDFINSKRDSINEILNYFDLETDKIFEYEDDVVNKSLPRSNIPLMRFFNKFTKSSKEPFLLLNVIFHKIIQKILITFKFSFIKKNKYQIQDEEFRNAIMESNHKLIQLCENLAISEYDYPTKNNK